MNDFSGDVAAYPVAGPHVVSQQSHAKWVTFGETELVFNLQGSATYSVIQIPINPGLPDFAPIGSGVMSKFERYHMRKLHVKYVPTVSGYAVAGQTGRVVLGMVYDAASLPPPDMRAAEGNIPNAPGYTSEELILTVSADKVERYTRADRNPAGTDIKTYDPGFIYIAVEGTQNADQIGEIHFEYEFALRNVLEVPNPLPRNLVVTRALLGPYTMNVGGNLSNFPFNGGASSVITMNGLSAELVDFTPAGGAAGTYLKLPLGRYQVRFALQFSTTGPGYANDVAVWISQNGPTANIANFPVSGTRESASTSYGWHNHKETEDVIEVTDPATNGVIVPAASIGCTAGGGVVWCTMFISVA